MLRAGVWRGAFGSVNIFGSLGHFLSVSSGFT